MIDIYFFIVYPISIIGMYGFRDGRYLIIKLNYFEAKEYEMRDAIDRRRRMSVTVPNYIDLRTRLEVGLATRSGLKKRKGGGTAERSFPSDCQRSRGRNGQRRTVLVYTYIERRGFDVCLDVAKKYNDPNKTSCTRSSILPLSLSLLLKLFKCTSRVLHDTDTCIPFAGSGREEWGRKKRKGSLGIKVCAFLSLIAKDFLDLFYLLFRVKNVEHFRFAKGYIELIFSILYQRNILKNLSTRLGSVLRLNNFFCRGTTFLTDGRILL